MNNEEILFTGYYNNIAIYEHNKRPLTIFMICLGGLCSSLMLIMLIFRLCDKLYEVLYAWIPFAAIGGVVALGTFAGLIGDNKRLEKIGIQIKYNFKIVDDMLFDDADEIIRIEKMNLIVRKKYIDIIINKVDFIVYDKELNVDKEYFLAKIKKIQRRVNK